MNSGAERQLTRALNIIGSNLINVFGFEVVGNNDTAIYVDQNSFGIHIFGAADNSVNATAKVFIHASWGAQIVTSAINTSDQAPNQYDDWSYVTELTNSQGYFAVSPH
ncbi:hypothetical protein, partial [Oenococcus oeni]|uniref:hypothetical protein n=1 Tax=Oenococcus oeni TaxID=1247 RepID=UPI001C5B7158